MQRPVPCPIKSWTVSSQHAQWCMACVCSLSHRESAIELGREKHPSRVGIEQNLLIVETVNVGNSLARYRVRVISRVANFCQWYATMPNPSRLVVQKVETVR